jgi:GNAT superfamily N-acetyltransferase
MIISLHGKVYADEYGYDQGFEAYVAKGLAEFIERFDPHADRLWVASTNGRVIGSIAIVKQPGQDAQLRWFFVAPEQRGHGLGTVLLTKAIEFCKEHHYPRVILWTTSDLKAAHHMYVTAGFRKTLQKAHHGWGKDLVEECYELRL